MRILIPTDFSENAVMATRYAIDLAKKSDGRLVVFHSYDVPHYERSLTTSLHVEMKEIAEEHMADFEKQHLKSAGVPYEVMVRIGNPIRMAKELVEAKGIEMVVMGTKGASGIEEFLIGSNAASIIQNVTVPVFIIPELAIQKPIKDIVMATDFEFKGKIPPIDQMKKIADLFGAKVHILHIQDEDGYPAGSRDLMARMFGDTPHDYTITKRNGNVEGIILQHCEKKNADAVAAITKTYSFFEGLFHKSLTSKLAYHTKIPMIALHEPKK